MDKPILLHLGDDVRWSHELYKQLEERFVIERSYSMGRNDFSRALEAKKFGDFSAIYRPFWSTGGEMGNWDEEIISLLPSSCKIFASAGAGFDWVDTKLLAERGIIYCNSASACTESVADAAIWLILSMFRSFTLSHLAARSLDPDQFSKAHEEIGEQAHNPNGFKLGIIGLGRIGQRIAQKARLAFEMEIVYNDIRRLPRELENSLGARYFEDLDEMLAVADCAVLATPFVGDTLMNAERFAKMKHGNRFVNIARGKLVDEEALVEALKTGRISGAGLDVHYDEPVVNPHLASMNNVELMCHTAGVSLDSHMGFERLGMENILSFLDGKGALTPVNEQWMKKAE